MSAYAYPRGAVIADGARAAAGLALSGAPLAFGDMPTWEVLLLGLIALVFVLYAVASLRRAISRIDVIEDGISLRGLWSTRLPWSEVERLRLAYYTTRRDGGGGWMQLTLAGPGRRVVIDSRIGGFGQLARSAAAAARQRALRLDAATIVNLRALGIDPEPRASIESEAR